jgi:hypothetical protein
MKFEKIDYKNLNAKAKEIYNFQKVSAVLADYGFTTMWLNNDWQGADFIAVHVDGLKYLKIQLKGRLSFDIKYIGKDIWICFIEDGDVYLYPHDEVMNAIPIIKDAVINNGGRSMSSIPKAYLYILEEYKLKS